MYALPPETNLNKILNITFKAIRTQLYTCQERNKNTILSPKCVCDLFMKATAQLEVNNIFFSFISSSPLLSSGHLQT